MAGEWMLLPPLIYLAQDFTVPRHWRGLKGVILGLVVFAIVSFAVMLGPIYLLGYMPLPRDAASRHAILAGSLVGGLLSMPLRSYVYKRMRRRAGFWV